MNDELSARHRAITLRRAGRPVKAICAAVGRFEVWFHKWWNRYWEAGPDGLDFSSLLLRIHPAASRVTLLARETPASLVVWDLLAVGDEDLREKPLSERRARLEAALRRLPETTVFPSQTNFVLVRVADAKAMFDGLKARRILVKNVHGWHPLLANCLRITVGTPEENDLLLAACTELCR